MQTNINAPRVKMSWLTFIRPMIADADIVSYVSIICLFHFFNTIEIALGDSAMLFRAHREVNLE